MIKWSPALKANCRRRSIGIGAEAVPRRVYKSLGVASGPVPSMRNLLDKSSVAQSLDGDRLTGSLRYPRRKASTGYERSQAPSAPSQPFRGQRPTFLQEQRKAVLHTADSVPLTSGPREALS